MPKCLVCEKPAVMQADFLPVCFCCLEDAARYAYMCVQQKGMSWCELHTSWGAPCSQCYQDAQSRVAEIEAGIMKLRKKKPKAKARKR